MLHVLDHPFRPGGNTSELVIDLNTYVERLVNEYTFLST